MTYATVMVSLALDRPNTRRLDVTVKLADQFDAGVIGVAASDFSPPLYYTSGEQAQKLLAQGSEVITKRTAELEAEFRAAMQGHARQVQWRCAVEIPAKYIALQARAADLVVTGAIGTLTDPFAVADPADLVMQVGRPLLVVPETTGPINLTSMLVAWKDCPEARRAVVDALPLLRKAGKVKVAEIVEDDGNHQDAKAGVADVVAWLGRHGVAATGFVPEVGGNVAVQLERIATAVDAGVVVAGAYGHSRFREWVLGGVTQHLVAHPSRCALLSH
ncbi:universal stress protein [Rhodopseudomonas palustris]|uniref:Universal stress protein n=1 Tax=Rhodopseudomonas palustris (strain BisB18) TaxID=316056 RepID=Q20Z61_RHOPB